LKKFGDHRARPTSPRPVDGFFGFLYGEEKVRSFLDLAFPVSAATEDGRDARGPTRVWRPGALEAWSGTSRDSRLATREPSSACFFFGKAHHPPTHRSFVSPRRRRNALPQECRAFVRATSTSSPLLPSSRGSRVTPAEGLTR
jgi:hypothetical protein